jgi:hypothetical protein
MRFKNWISVGVPVAIAMAIATPGFGRDPAIVTKEARDAVAAEFTECASYYAIAARGFERSHAPGKERDEAVATYTKSASLAFWMSAAPTNRKEASVRMELALQSMGRQLGSNWENLSTIDVQHSDRCKNLADGVDKRLEYWKREMDKLPPDLPQAIQ